MLDEKIFYIDVGSKPFGPVSLREIRSQVDRGIMGMMHYVYDTRAKEWAAALSILDRYSARLNTQIPTSRKSPVKNETAAGVGLIPEEFQTRMINEQMPTLLRPHPGAGPVDATGPQTEDRTVIDESVLRPPPDSQDSTQPGAGVVNPDHPGRMLKVHERQWVLEQGGRVTGTFDYLTIMLLFAEGQIHQGDVVWEAPKGPRLSPWEVFPHGDRTRYAELFDKTVAAPLSEKKERRGGARIPLGCLIQVRAAGASMIFRGWDISSTHLSFVSLAPQFKPLDQVSVSLKDQNGHHFNVRGQIVAFQTLAAAPPIPGKRLKYLVELDEAIDPGTLKLTD